MFRYVVQNINKALALAALVWCGHLLALFLIYRQPFCLATWRSIFILTVFLLAGGLLSIHMAWFTTYTASGSAGALGRLRFLFGFSLLGGLLTCLYPDGWVALGLWNYHLAVILYLRLRRAVLLQALDAEHESCQSDK